MIRIRNERKEIHHATQDSQGRDKHANLDQEHLAVLWFRSSLVNHLEHGNLLSRPLPRAWRQTIGELERPHERLRGRVDPARSKLCNRERHHPYWPTRGKTGYFSYVHSSPYS